MGSPTKEGPAPAWWHPRPAMVVVLLVVAAAVAALVLGLTQWSAVRVARTAEGDPMGDAGAGAGAGGGGEGGQGVESEMDAEWRAAGEEVDVEVDQAAPAAAEGGGSEGGGDGGAKLKRIDVGDGRGEAGSTVDVGTGDRNILEVGGPGGEGGGEPPAAGGVTPGGAAAAAWEPSRRNRQVRPGRYCCCSLLMNRMSFNSRGQETRVHNALNGMSGQGGSEAYCSSRHRMPSHSRNEGLNTVPTTWRAISAPPFVG